MFDSARYDSPLPKHGDGTSYTTAEKVGFYELKIWLPGQGPMRDLVKAESLQQAMMFARNRYPGCLVEVPEKVSTMTRLARSSDGPKKAAQRTAKKK